MTCYIGNITNQWYDMVWEIIVAHFEEIHFIS